MIPPLDDYFLGNGDVACGNARGVGILQVGERALCGAYSFASEQQKNPLSLSESGFSERRWTPLD